MKIRTKIVSASSRVFNAAHRAGFCAAIEPIIIVNEFPKSGGTWFAKLIAAAVDLPFIDSTLLPPGCPCVIRNHWDPRKLRLPAIFVVRDCRDVMVSLFHHRVRNMEKTQRLKAEYKNILGADLCLTDIREQMAGFIRVEFEVKGYGNYLGWTDHVRYSLAAVEENQRAIYVRYEDILENPLGVLRDTIIKICNKEISSDKLELVINLYNIDMMKKNKPVANNQTTFVRVGRAGNWRGSFSAEAEEVLLSYAGDVMRELDYLD